MPDTLTVGEVIEKLKQFPSDLETIFVYDSGCDRSIYDRCFAVKWLGGWVNPPRKFLVLNVHPDQHWGGHDTEQEQINYTSRK